MREKIGDICELINGYAFKPTQWSELGLPIIRIQNLNKMSAAFNHFNGDIKEKYIIESGDLLFSWSGTPGTSFGAFEWNRGKAVLNQHIFKVIPIDKIDKRYFRYALNGILHKVISKAHGGVGLQHITKKELVNLEVSVPSIDEQHHKVMILEKTEHLIECRKTELELLDDLVKSRFVEMFESDVYDNVKMKDVCGFITKGTTPKAKEISEEPFEDSIPYLKVYNLSYGGTLLFEEKPQYIPNSVHSEALKRSKVYPNDVLMNIVGPPLGKFALVPESYNEWNINQAIAIFRATEKVIPRYVLYALMQPRVLRPFIDAAVGIRQQNLNLEQCRNLEIPLPPIDVQEEFSDFVQQVDKLKVEVQKSLDETQMLFDSLMQGYFD